MLGVPEAENSQLCTDGGDSMFGNENEILAPVLPQPRMSTHVLTSYAQLQCRLLLRNEGHASYWLTCAVKASLDAAEHARSYTFILIDSTTSFGVSESRMPYMA